MVAIIKDISDPKLPLPEFLVLDASLILELQPPPGKPNPNQVIALDFLRRLSNEAKRGNTFPLLPLLALEECYFKLCERLFKDYCQPGQQWHILYKQDPSKIKYVIPTIRKFKMMLDAFPIEILEPEDLSVQPKGKAPLLSSRMSELIEEFLVLPKDATILSDAERLGIFNVASLDRDWIRANRFNVYTIP